jgi:TatD DNase family protein
LIPGWDAASSLAGAAIAARIGWARVAIGIHPSAADLHPNERSALLARVAEAQISAVGETGIDTKRDGVPLAVQRANLDAHLAVALEHGKPLILHCRSAAGSDAAQRELIAALRAAGFGDTAATRAFDGRVPFILHSASGSAAYVDEALALGGGVSISGLAFRPEESATGEWVSAVPADRLLTETDAPWLVMPGAPDPRRNEPANVRLTLEWLAERRRDDPAELAAQLVRNFDRMFPPPTAV